MWSSHISRVKAPSIPGRVPTWGSAAPGRVESAAPPPLPPPGGGEDHERPFAIPSFHQKCRPPKSANPGHCPSALSGP